MSENLKANSKPAILLQALTKSYGNAKRPVVQGITLGVRSGQIFALVGVNGAGKTTVIRMATGLAYPSAGAVRLLGQDPFLTPRVKRYMGAVVEAPAAFYPYMTGKQNLEQHARFIQLKLSSHNDKDTVKDTVEEDKTVLNRKQYIKQRIDELLEQLELIEVAGAPVRTYSLGMRQRLGVATALLGKPKILILDEPTSSIDPLSISLIQKALRNAADCGAAVLLSTHHTERVTEYCDTVGILHQGWLVKKVDLAPLRNQYLLHVAKPQQAMQRLQNFPYIQHVAMQGEALVLTLTDEVALPRVTYDLARARLAVLSLQPLVFDLAYYQQEGYTEFQNQKHDVFDAFSESTPITDPISNAFYKDVNKDYANKGEDFRVSARVARNKPKNPQQVKPTAKQSKGAKSVGNMPQPSRPAPAKKKVL